MTRHCCSGQIVGGEVLHGINRILSGLLEQDGQFFNSSIHHGGYIFGIDKWGFQQIPWSGPG